MVLCMRNAPLKNTGISFLLYYIIDETITEYPKRRLMGKIVQTHEPSASGVIYEERGPVSVHGPRE